jgi:hypothetical protein
MYSTFGLLSAEHRPSFSSVKVNRGHAHGKVLLETFQTVSEEEFSEIGKV